MNTIETKLRELENTNNPTIQPDELQAKLIAALREAVICLSKVSSADSRDTLLAAADALIKINKILNGGK